MKVVPLIIVSVVVVIVTLTAVAFATQTNNEPNNSDDTDNTVPATPMFTKYSLSEASHSSNVTTQIEDGEGQNQFIITIHCDSSMVKLLAHFDKAKYDIHYSIVVIESEGPFASFNLRDGWYGTKLSQWNSSHTDTYLSGNTTNEFVIEFQTSIFILGEARFNIIDLGP